VGIIKLETTERERELFAFDFRPKKVDFAMDSFVILSSSVCSMATSQVSERKISARCERANFQFPFLSQVRTTVLTKWLQMDTGVTANPVFASFGVHVRV
jgi:hypothetical protein